ncbi:MAG: hypothetical protein NVS9B4_22830 [Candidatus Acidiferrum sp.]
MRLSFSSEPRQVGRLLALVAVCFLCPSPGYAWGRNGTKLVVSKAITALPADIRDFFEANRDFLQQHVTDPLDALSSSVEERHNHFLFLDKYGRFPYNELPRSYKAAVAKFGKGKVAANGLLPWQVGVYSQKLTEAMKAGRWDEARLDAALLATYVAESHDPFNTTDDFDGHLSGQAGVNERFGTVLIDRYSSFFPMRPNDPSYIGDPTNHAFEACLGAHSSIESILLADRTSRHGGTSFNDEYYDRFYNLAAGVLIRQLSEAATDAASYWLTAWVNAGKPQLPH